MRCEMIWCVLKWRNLCGLGACCSLRSGSQRKESLHETPSFAISAHLACGLRPLYTDVKIGQSHRLLTFANFLVKMKYKYRLLYVRKFQNEIIYGCRLKKIEVCGNIARPRAISIVVTSSLQFAMRISTICRSFLAHVQI
jgi:hypothetical protein